MPAKWQVQCQNKLLYQQEKKAKKNSFLVSFFTPVGLYPTDLEEQLLCDEIFEVMQELSSKVPQHPDAEEKKKLREAFVANTLPKYFTFLANKSKGTYFINGKLTIADLIFYSTMKSIRSGQWDHVDKDIDSQYPELGTLIALLDADEKLAAAGGKL